MTSFALNAPTKKARTFSEWVWFESATALHEGQAVCYNWDYGTATDFDARRYNHVEPPTSLNAQYFAGVAARDYTAVTGGQLIEVYLPGSVCNIYVAVTTVKGAGIFTFDVTSGFAGQFRYEGLEGEGSAQPMQTTTYVATAQLCMALLQKGPPSGGVEVVDIVDNDAIGVLMIGGTTLVTGATIGAGHCTYTLADGARENIRKKFGVITTEIATNNLVITVTTGRVDALDDANLSSVTFAGASTTVGTKINLAWNGAWFVTGATQTMPALA